MLIYLYFFSTKAGYTFWENFGLVVVSKVAITCSTLNKIAKDFSLVVQDFKIGDGLKKWEDAVCRDIPSILGLISSYPFLFGKHVFMCLMSCQSGYSIKLALEFCSFFY